MLTIKIPNDNVKERQYILDVLFGEFLGIPYRVIIDSDCRDWKILLDNGNKVIFEDHFFTYFKSNLEYLHLDNIPKTISFDTKQNNEFLTKDDLPILYGKKSHNISNNIIYCGIDIFASSFFMLTRWEEYVNQKRDRLNRFSAYDSLAFKCNFLDRPIVNEYLEMLWNILVYLKYDDSRKIKKFNTLLTHDIDFLLLRNIQLKKIFRTLAGDILKRKNLKLALSYLKDYLTSCFDMNKDPYNTFDYLMKLSEKFNLKSYFFFMARGETRYDNNYSVNNKYLKEVVSCINHRKHYIGIHGTFNSYKNQILFNREKRELEGTFATSIEFGRQHYLRFEVPTTWQIWENSDMKWDSTAYYPEVFGFRVGTCYEYRVFNILTQKHLKLIEKPLIIMDGFATYDSQKSSEHLLFEISNIIDNVFHYKGTLILLWHNSSFHNRQWKRYNNLYEDILSLIDSKGA